MATNKMNTEYVWGDAVCLKDTAPSLLGEYRVGSICGIRMVETESVSLQLGEPIGTVMYLVESSDGKAVEIPERFLSPMKTEPN